jgi:hypothetical protein
MNRVLPILIFTACTICFPQTLTIDSAVDKIPVTKFPTLARYSGIRGNVILTSTLREGRLEKVTSSESHKVLSNAAVAFVRAIQFKPTATGTLVLVFHFILTEKPDAKEPWQRLSIDSDANTISIEASRKVIHDTDYFH